MLAKDFDLWINWGIDIIRTLVVFLTTLTSFLTSTFRQEIPAYFQNVLKKLMTKLSLI